MVYTFSLIVPETSGVSEVLTHLKRLHVKTCSSYYIVFEAHMQLPGVSYVLCFSQFTCDMWWESTYLHYSGEADVEQPICPLLSSLFLFFLYCFSFFPPSSIPSDSFPPSFLSSDVPSEHISRRQWAHLTDPDRRLNPKQTNKPVDN